MEQIRGQIMLRASTLMAIILLSSLPTIMNAYSFVLCHNVPQLPANRSIRVRYDGCELELSNSCPTLFPQIGCKSPSSIIFGTKFKQVLCDDKTVRCISRKPGRTDYLWYDIELVLENQETEDIATGEAPQYHWIIKKRELDQVPLRIPESAIIIYLPATFIDSLIDEHGASSVGTFCLPVFKLKKDITTQQLEDFLDESDMRLIKDKRFFSNTTAIGTVPTAVQLLNS